MPRGQKNTKIATKTATKTAAAKTKINMQGGAFSDDTMSTLLVIIIVVLGFLIAWIMYKNVKSRAISRSRSHTKVIENDSESVEPSQPTQVIKIVTNNEVEDRPPIYPRHNPEYPLQRVPQGYQQVGVLVSQDSAENKPIIMPLYGRKMYSKDRWEYYTASDEYHMWRIPVSINNRDCQDDVGCDEIYNGDNVTVPDYANKVFAARIYKYRDPRLFSERY
jgi:hypothetical protein